MTLKEKIRERKENRTLTTDGLGKKMRDALEKVYELNFALDEELYHKDGEPDEKTIIGIMLKVEEQAEIIQSAAAQLKYASRFAGRDQARKYIERILDA